MTQVWHVIAFPPKHKPGLTDLPGQGLSTGFRTHGHRGVGSDYEMLMDKFEFNQKKD